MSIACMCRTLGCCVPANVVSCVLQHAQCAVGVARNCSLLSLGPCHYGMVAHGVCAACWGMTPTSTSTLRPSTLPTVWCCARSPCAAGGGRERRVRLPRGADGLRAGARQAAGCRGVAQHREWRRNRALEPRTPHRRVQHPSAQRAGSGSVSWVSLQKLLTSQ